MTKMLRQVLNAFESADEPQPLNAMARALGVSPGMLQGMIEYWVRKGRLREASSEFSQCQTCGGAEGCPFVVKMPRRYELATEAGAAAESAAASPCRCCR